MTSPTPTETPLSIPVSSGTIAARRWGSVEAPLTICLPGLSQDERCYAPLGRTLGSETRQVVAIAPRGRGGSSRTARGSYGWPSHAQDVLEVASALGHDRFNLVGWSFGGLVSLQLAADAPSRLERVVLIDVLGRPDASSLGPVMAGLERLGATYPTREDYVQTVLASGAMSGHEGFWRDYLSADLVEVEGGFTTRTDKEAVVEDATYGSQQDLYSFWPSLTMPTLVVRAAKPILPGLGFIVTGVDRDRFVVEIPRATVVEVAANHYNVGLVAPTLRAIATFLDT